MKLWANVRPGGKYVYIDKYIQWNIQKSYEVVSVENADSRFHGVRQTQALHSRIGEQNRPEMHSFGFLGVRTQAWLNRFYLVLSDWPSALSQRHERFVERRMKALHVPTLKLDDRPLDLESSACQSQQNGNERSVGQASINQTKIDLLAMEAFPSIKSLQILLASGSASQKSYKFGCIVAWCWSAKRPRCKKPMPLSKERRLLRKRPEFLMCMFV